jgi:hypothetical protein
MAGEWKSRPGRKVFEEFCVGFGLNKLKLGFLL